MRGARVASDLMMNFLAIGEWGVGSGEWGVGGDRKTPFPTPYFPQFDYRRVFDVGDGAVIFAEQSQVGHDQFVATALVKIDHSPAHRQPLAVLRQSVMPRVARCVNPRA